MRTKVEIVSAPTGIDLQAKLNKKLEEFDKDDGIEITEIKFHPIEAYMYSMIIYNEYN